MNPSASPPTLGVCIVTYNSADVITGCLATLFAAENVQLRVVVVDNASSDDTVGCIRNWAARKFPPEVPPNLPFNFPPPNGPIALHEAKPGTPLRGSIPLTVLRAPINGGFAAGVNLGLDHLMQNSDIGRFWILNPDCVVPPDTPGALASYPAPPDGFALIGGRINYLFPAGHIQSDGGRINWLNGATLSVNRGYATVDTSPPAADTLDFIPGASMVASRAFLDHAGPMPENYFLYYEEVDWALRRGALPLLYCEDAPVYHYAGSAIGSGSTERASTAFSVYFLYRARFRFLRRYCFWSLPTAYLYALAKAGQHAFRGQWRQLHALFCAINGLSPPTVVRSRLSSDAARIAFDSQPSIRSRFFNK